MAKTVKSVRVTGEIEKRVKQYSIENDISEADAYRELIKRGLESSDCQEHLQEIYQRLDMLESVDHGLEQLEERVDEINQKSKERRGLLSRLF